MKRLYKTLLATALVGSVIGLQAAPAPVQNEPQAPSDRESTQPGTDAMITTKVRTQLMATEGVPSTRIEVTTQNGTVMLSGNIDTKDQVEKAVAAAKLVKGVHAVDSTALTPSK